MIGPGPDAPAESARSEQMLPRQTALSSRNTVEAFPRSIGELKANADAALNLGADGPLQDRPSPLVLPFVHAMADVNFEPLLDTGEAARLIGIHPKTLEKWAREARVPAYNLGRWKFRASELDAWLRRSVHSNAANSAA